MKKNHKILHIFIFNFGHKIFCCSGQVRTATSGSGKFLPKIPIFLPWYQKTEITIMLDDYFIEKLGSPPTKD